MATKNNSTDDGPFVRVKDPSVLLPILEKRLPQSALMYNSVKMIDRVHDKDSIKFYTMDGDIDESSWIVYKTFGNSFGNVLMISANREKSKVSREEMVNIFTTCKLFDWHESYFVAAMEEWVYSIILEVSVDKVGNGVEVHPCYLYYRDREECLELDPFNVQKAASNVEVKAFDPVLGTKFIRDTWMFATDDSVEAIKESIELRESGAVYVDGKPVAGVITQAIGMLGALYTLQDHRGKGYAQAAMFFAYKEQAKKGIIPCSTVELRNTGSIKFHENKLGCKIACRVIHFFHKVAQF